MPQRLPGSALLLYPVGFTPSIPGFLFRSVLTPIIIWALALSIIVATFACRKSDAATGGCLVVGLATLPLFYHFECDDVLSKAYQISAQWGMVDALQAAVSSLAVCLIIAGIGKGFLSFV